MNATRNILIITVICALAIPSFADWPDTDDHKMHWPQLPDPFGWDVFAGTTADGTQKVLADDWLCTQSGPVDDIHFWGSRQGEWEVNPPLPG
ncbi:hypothetical protein LCGC14_2513840, partial [marine sediment metagenome]